MKTIINPTLKAVMLFALPVGFLVSCDSKKNSGDSTKEKAQIEVIAESKVVPTGMPLEEFKSQFFDILRQKDLMQSALTKKVNALCQHLDLRLLEQMLEFAAGDRPEGVIVENWLLGYNELMAVAGNSLGESASDYFYALASNHKANPIIRDYASQHFMRNESRFMMKLQSAGASEDIRKHLDQLLSKAEQLVSSQADQSDTLPGATLLGIAALAEKFEHYPAEKQMLKERVSKITMPILNSWDSQNVSTRNAALQTAARLGVEDAGPIVWNIAIDRNAETLDRLGAIGALRYYPELIQADALGTSCRNNEKLLKAVKSLAK